MANEPEIPDYCAELFADAIRRIRALVKERDAAIQRAETAEQQWDALKAKCARLEAPVSIEEISAHGMPITPNDDAMYVFDKEGIEAIIGARSAQPEAPPTEDELERARRRAITPYVSAGPVYDKTDEWEARQDRQDAEKQADGAAQ